MRIVRYERGGHAGTGILEGGIVHEVEGDLFEGPRPGASIAPIGQVSLLPPVRPGKIVAVGLNYLDHILVDGFGRERPANPIIFLKPPSSLVGHDSVIVLPEGPVRVESEAELAGGVWPLAPGVRGGG